MRGKVQPERDVQDAARITPACAGKRARPSPCRSQSRDHPRACGEKCWILSSNTPLMGSPPRMRGKAFGLVLYKVEIGITSACAGKSKHKWAVSNFRWDHPRVCGEKNNLRQAFAVQQGSPPRVREKPHPASDRKLGRVRGTKRSSGPAPAAAPAGLAGSCPASPPWSYPPRITVSRPRP